MQNFKMNGSEYLRCAPKYTSSRLNNRTLPPPRHLRRLASRAFGARPPHSKILATPLHLYSASSRSCF